MTEAAAKTPSYTLEALERAIASASVEGPAKEKFIRIDARVLEWLIADSRALGSEPDATPAGAVVAETSGVTAGETAPLLMVGGLPIAEYIERQEACLRQVEAERDDLAALLAPPAQFTDDFFDRFEA